MSQIRLYSPISHLRASLISYLCASLISHLCASLISRLCTSLISRLCGLMSKGSTRQTLNSFHTNLFVTSHGSLGITGVVGGYTNGVERFSDIEVIYGGMLIILTSPSMSCSYALLVCLQVMLFWMTEVRVCPPTSFIATANGCSVSREE